MPFPPRNILGDIGIYAPHGVRLSVSLFSPQLKRARDLFFASLRPGERKQFEKYHCLTVCGSNGTDLFTILPFSAHNVIDHADKRVLCAVPATPGGVFAQPLPLWDVWLAQKLVIETNVRYFRQVAYSRRLRPMVA